MIGVLKSTDVNRPSPLAEYYCRDRSQRDAQRARQTTLCIIVGLLIAVCGQNIKRELDQRTLMIRSNTGCMEAGTAGDASCARRRQTTRCYPSIA